MLDIINRYAHGFVAIPVILACRKKGLFELLSHHSALTLKQIVDRLGANSGHLQVALRMMQSLQWLSRNDSGEYSLTKDAEIYKQITEEILQLYRFPFDAYFQGEQNSDSLKPWIELSRKRWNIENELIADFLDGMLVIPVLLRLHNLHKQGSRKTESSSLFSTLNDAVAQELGELFINKNWAEGKEGHLVLTPLGRFMVERAMITAVTASYKPMLSRMDDLLFGDCQEVFARDASGHESHVERTFNVEGSGFQHQKYFADVDAIVLSIFNRMPYEEQPKYIADMGCGDGSLLKRVYEVIAQKSERGKVLEEYPLLAIGVDYNEASLRATETTLVQANIPHLTIKGDIGNPEQMVQDLRQHGIEDVENILHIRSFLDHDRPFITPEKSEQVEYRSHLPYQGVYVDAKGDLIPAPVMVQSLVEHLGRWSSVVNQHGLIILEVHCLEPDVVSQFLDRSENLHFDAYQSFSMQHMVEADVFLMAAAAVGLFPKLEFSKGYPRTFPFTRITLNCFEKKPYTIRHPRLSDLPELLNLEARCWPEHLRATAEQIRQRIERFPNGHCVLEIEGNLVGVMYSQRISSIETLKTTTYADVPSLHDPQGSTIQLIAINLLPEMQAQALGNELRKFMLQLCRLKSGIEIVVGVTRCKNYAQYAPMPMAEYLEKCNEFGQILDPIVRFHVQGGATIKSMIPNYRPEDVENQGMGVLIQYDLHNLPRQDDGKAIAPPKQDSGAVKTKKIQVGEAENLPENLPENLSNIIEQCIRDVMGQERQGAFSPQQPLMEMGLDSMELLELRALLSKRLGVKLKPTFLFEYGTAIAIRDYFQGKKANSSKWSASPSPMARAGNKQVDHSFSLQTKNALLEIEAMRSRLDVLNSANTEPIAIIGMGCRFPGAKDPQAFWKLLHDGRVAITEVPPDRWDVDAFYDPNLDSDDKMNTRWGGFLEDVDRFDPAFFGISSREAAAMDPQQRLLLQTSWEALENAAVPPDGLAGSKTGVFVGLFTLDYQKLLLNAPFRAGTGILNSIIANRLSYILDLQGPSITVDTACSSSLVAVHMACQSLRTRECNLALAGGVNMILSPEWTIAFSQAGMMASDGLCKTFDAAADGYVRGEGCGVVVLKRLSNALKDGDRILALLRGSAVNQDGRSVGLTAPNGLAQQALIRQALENAGVKPDQIDFIEAHGTGTPLGDATEVESLAAVLAQGRSPEQKCALGSVKTNIGHLEGAAGIAGLIKAILSLEHGQIPPHPHLKKINPNIALETTPFVIPTKQSPGTPEIQPRFAGVSSFGIGGTNAHVVLEAAPANWGFSIANVEFANSGVERSHHILTLSAKSEKALKELASRYCNHCAETFEESSLADICFTANTARSHFNQRLAIVADSSESLHQQLVAFSQGEEKGEESVPVSGQVGQMDNKQRPKIAFLFTGQGGQYVDMGRQLYETQPTFRKALDLCDELLRPHLPKSLLSVLYPETGNSSPIDETTYTQPALFAIEYALASLWQSWGIEPDAVMGHSVGEYVAACLAGVFSLEDGLRLIAERGRLMGSLPKEGTMAAVFASEAIVAEAIAPYQGSISIAGVNGPKQTVISGNESAVLAVLESLEDDFIISRPLNVSHAFHSHLMEPILDTFEQTATQVQFSAPTKSLISNVTGQIVSPETILDAQYWRNHIRQPVRFYPGIQTLADAGYEIFLEMGPQDILIGMGQRCLPKGTGTWLASLKPEEDNWRSLLESLATLYIKGININWAGFDQDYLRKRVALPTYPFQRKRCWLDPSEIKSYAKKE